MSFSTAILSRRVATAASVLLLAAVAARAQTPAAADLSAISSAKAPATAEASAKAEPGLLFYLSGEKGTTADVAAPGTAEPTFVAEVKKIADGAKGAALECGDYTTCHKILGFQ